ncbi:alpha-N-acetylglucosaminidase (NAGLU) [Achlya hypogyna]|uniref:Alpha-N-acetylglucosaminidase (NAGLU) n=1 Tax=Achlya hypogyna TaxID=1202772 RepID=A0A0A7CPQ6_ACHHY|nr:secreted protein [Achlya hypogyna]OQR83136.1 alpha-N-acetylglucosaminidase (NAGLU) [Achlya hypogyna]
MRSIVAAVVAFLLRGLLGVPAGAVLLPRPDHDMIGATKGLISRRLGPSYVDQFVLDTMPLDASSGMDVVHIEASEGRIYLQASSATAMGFGLHAYLKAIATATNWEDDPLVLPPVLPGLSRTIQLQRQAPITYYENVCTFSYSQWTWSWAKWERHIDWMVLNGINVPLAFTGQEKIWQTTFLELGVSQAGLDAFFAGAGFLAWGRMGNIQGSWVRGPLPQDFIDNQFALQLQILARMRTFGMVPALPAFGGHVPAELLARYPAAKAVRSAPWLGFDTAHTSVPLLDPTDPLFRTVGEAYLATQARLLNYSAALYQTDTFNEMDPAAADPAYLKAASTAVLGSMRAVNPAAVWLMQGWLFSFSSFWSLDRIRAYLQPLPRDGLIVLDLYSEVRPMWEKTDGFFGKYWVYCVLHNFGGSLGMRGDLATLATAPVAARAAADGRLLGVGLTMEGINQNYVVYDLALQMPWATAVVDVATYVQAFARARYHLLAPNTAVSAAWHRLATTVYAATRAFGGVTKNIVTLRPRWGLLQDRFMPTSLVHAPDDVLFAWRQLLAAAASTPALATHDSFLRDIVDVTRQALSDALATEYAALEAIVRAQTAPITTVNAIVARMRRRMDELDRVLSTHVDFMLGPWLAAARALGNDGDYFVYEAKNQLTRWGHNNGNALADYAGKDWGGLVRSYYRSRWEIWFQRVRQAYVNRRPVAADELHTALEAFELAWQLNATMDFPVAPIEAPLEVARQVYASLTGSAPPEVLAASTGRADKYMCMLDCLW